jgi:hypothetical protein
MIAEQLPQLAAMSRMDKWAVYWELEDELKDDDFDVSETPEGKAAIMELIEARLQHYSEHPETAISQDELQERMKTWKTKIRQSS